MTDNTQDLNEILLGHGAEEGEFTESLKQAILDWHNKQTEALLNELLVDVSSPDARIDQAEMIELINLYINKLKESSND